MNNKTCITQQRLFETWAELNRLKRRTRKPHPSQKLLEYNAQLAGSNSDLIENRITELKQVLNDAVVMKDARTEKPSILAIIVLAVIMTSLTLYIMTQIIPH